MENDFEQMMKPSQLEASRYTEAMSMQESLKERIMRHACREMNAGRNKRKWKNVFYFLSYAASLRGVLVRKWK